MAAGTWFGGPNGPWNLPQFSQGMGNYAPQFPGLGQQIGQALQGSVQAGQFQYPWMQNFLPGRQSGQRNMAAYNPFLSGTRNIVNPYPLNGRVNITAQSVPQVNAATNPFMGLYGAAAGGTDPGGGLLGGGQTDPTRPPTSPPPAPPPAGGGGPMGPPPGMNPPLPGPPPTGQPFVPSWVEQNRLPAGTEPYAARPGEVWTTRGLWRSPNTGNPNAPGNALWENVLPFDLLGFGRGPSAEWTGGATPYRYGRGGGNIPGTGTPAPRGLV